MTEGLSDAPLGDIGTKLLHEDEQVKVWEMVLQPGEESAAHEHLLDHILIVIEGDRIAGVPHARSTGVSAEYVEVDVHPGMWFRQERGGVEIARNVGKTVFRELLIELKDKT